MACVGRKAYESKTGKTSPATFTEVFYPRHVPGAVFFYFSGAFFVYGGGRWFVTSQLYAWNNYSVV